MNPKKQKHFKKHLFAAKLDKYLGIASPCAVPHGHMFAYDEIKEDEWSSYVENQWSNWHIIGTMLLCGVWFLIKPFIPKGAKHEAKVAKRQRIKELTLIEIPAIERYMRFDNSELFSEFSYVLSNAEEYLAELKEAIQEHHELNETDRLIELYYEDYAKQYINFNSFLKLFVESDNYVESIRNEYRETYYSKIEGHSFDNLQKQLIALKAELKGLEGKQCK